MIQRTDHKQDISSTSVADEGQSSCGVLCFIYRLHVISAEGNNSVVIVRGERDETVIFSQCEVLAVDTKH